MKQLSMCIRKYILKGLAKIKSPLLLSVSIILVIKVFELLLPETFSSLPAWILKIILYCVASYMMGFTVGLLQAKGQFIDNLFRTVLLTISLLYITPLLMKWVLGILFVTVAWILAVYWIEIDIVQFIKEINKAPITKKETAIHAIKDFAELLTFAVAVLELLNLLIPLISQQ